MAPLHHHFEAGVVRVADRDPVLHLVRALRRGGVEHIENQMSPGTMKRHHLFFPQGHFTACMAGNSLLNKKGWKKFYNFRLCGGVF